MAPKKGKTESGKSGGNKKEANRKAAELGIIYNLWYIYHYLNLFYYIYSYILILYSYFM